MVPRVCCRWCYIPTCRLMNCCSCPCHEVLLAASPGSTPTTTTCRCCCCTAVACSKRAVVVVQGKLGAGTVKTELVHSSQGGATLVLPSLPRVRGICDICYCVGGCLLQLLQGLGKLGADTQCHDALLLEPDQQRQIPLILIATPLLSL